MMISTTLPELLKQNGLTLRALSKKSGVPISTLSEWSSNRPPKNPLQVKKVAEALGCTLHYFLFGEDDSQEPIRKILKEDFFSGTFEISVKRVKVK